MYLFNVAVMFMNLFHIKNETTQKKNMNISKYIFNNLFMLLLMLLLYILY